MIRTALLAAATLSVFALPMSAAAQAGDPALDAFKSICVANANNYPAEVQAAAGGGWVDTQLIPTADSAMSITSTTAKTKVVGKGTLTLLLTQGLRHTKGGNVPEADCKISTDQPDAGVVKRTTDWLGFPADGGDGSTLAAFYVKTGPQPSHVADPNAAMAAGGFSIIKAQEDPGSVILVYTAFSK